MNNNFPKDSILYEEYNPSLILTIDHKILRNAGLSIAKAKYIKNLSQYFLDHQVEFLNMHNMADQTVIDFLVEIKGIGTWTAEMFLIFGLGCPDVFSTGDLGLEKGAIKIYNLDEKVSKDELLRLSENWRPNRSLASKILWKYLEVPDAEIN